MPEPLTYAELFKDENIFRFDLRLGWNSLKKLLHPYKKPLITVVAVMTVIGLLIGFIAGIWYWYAATDSSTWGIL